MADQQPQDKPQPQSRTGQDWSEVSIQEIEQTLSNAAELAYELAGDVGTASVQPGFRDTSGLESVESALDVELKQLEHLVGKTKEQLSEDPPRTASDKAGQPAAIPDFMSEFLSDEPVKVVPDTRTLAGAAAEGGASTSQSGGSFVSTDVSSAPRVKAVDATSKPGLIGVGSLGRNETRKATKPEKPKTEEPAKPGHRPGWPRLLEGPLYRLCDMAIFLLEVVDRPFAKLSPTTRRALSVTAIAAFCICLLMFVMSLLAS